VEEEEGGTMGEMAAWGGDSMLLLLLEFPVSEFQKLLREEEEREKREERRKGRKKCGKFSILEIFGEKKL
jgi:hypothetical protein